MLKAMIQLPITLEQLITTVQQLKPSDRQPLNSTVMLNCEVLSSLVFDLNLNADKISTPLAFSSCM